MAVSDYLFHKMDLFNVTERAKAAMLAEIASIDGNQLLNTNVDDLVAFFADKFSLDVPALDEASMSVYQDEVPVDVSQDFDRAIWDRSRPAHVPGTVVTLIVPFSGEPEMFHVRPNTYSSPPRGQLVQQNVVFELRGARLSPEMVKSEIDGWLRSIRQYLEWQRQSLRGFNETLVGMARNAINQRRTKLLADQNLVAGLGIPVRRRADAPATYTAPEVRRKIAPKMPPATPGVYKPDPELEMAEYEGILGIIQSMVHVMERSPKAFHDLNEEGIRSHFLVQLNGQYQGQATGETFNYHGKTDILIRSGDRNIFIAECKFWDGPSKLTETIDQLLNYVPWRDSKAAILVFNRRKDFTKVLEAIPPTAKAHPKFRKEISKPSETAFRYVFKHQDDDAKNLIVTIMAFDVPRPEE
jgi:hypothetical protein